MFTRNPTKLPWRTWTIQAPTDAIVRITTTNVCGSALHMYKGRTPAEPGFVFGHKNQGIVEEVGDACVRSRSATG